MILLPALPPRLPLVVVVVAAAHPPPPTLSRALLTDPLIGSLKRTPLRLPVCVPLEPPFFLELVDVDAAAVAVALARLARPPLLLLSRLCLVLEDLRRLPFASLLLAPPPPLPPFLAALFVLGEAAAAESTPPSLPVVVVVASGAVGGRPALTRR